MSGVKSDIEIARAAKMKLIKDVLATFGVPDETFAFSPMGRHIAKLNIEYIDKLKEKNSNLILVTAITPTPAGEGKTTTSVGLCDGLSGIPGYRARIRPIVSRITIHWPSFYNVVTGKTLALPNLIALQHIPLSPAGVIAKRPAPIALPNSCAAEWRMAPDAVFSPYASVRYFTPHMVHSQYNLL